MRRAILSHPRLVRRKWWREEDLQKVLDPGGTGRGDAMDCLALDCLEGCLKPFSAAFGNCGLCFLRGCQMALALQRLSRGGPLRCCSRKRVTWGGGGGGGVLISDHRREGEVEA